MKQSQVYINRGGAIIINANGRAHHTGYVALDWHRVGAKMIAVYKGKYCFFNERHTTTLRGEQIFQYPSDQPFPLDDFLRLTCWTPT